jgi:1-deoxy-D-xylulose-5-phosphate synthase
MLDAADKVAEQLSATLVNMRFIKPLDEALLNELSGQHEIIVTLENNAVAGGAGSAVNECLLAQGNTVQTLNLGLPDRFVNHGTQNELLTTLGLDVNGIIESIQHATQEQVPVSTL